MGYGGSGFGGSSGGGYNSAPSKLIEEMTPEEKQAYLDRLERQEQARQEQKRKDRNRRLLKFFLFVLVAGAIVGVFALLLKSCHLI